MTFREIWQTLTPMYDDAEAKAIVRTVLEDKWGFTLTDIYSGKVTQLSEENQSLLAKITHRLRQGEPVHTSSSRLPCPDVFAVACRNRLTHWHSA